jgi:hypothetical protein
VQRQAERERHDAQQIIGGLQVNLRNEAQHRENLTRETQSNNRGPGPDHGFARGGRNNEGNDRGGRGIGRVNGRGNGLAGQGPG